MRPIPMSAAVLFVATVGLANYPGGVARAADPTAADVAALPVARGQNQFSGLYVQQRAVFFGRSMSLEYHLFYFFPDGHCFLGTPPAGTVADRPGEKEWAELVKADPKNCATYVQSGDTITFQRAGEKPQTQKFAFEKSGDPGTLLIDTLGAVKREGFKEGAAIDAKYEGGATVSSGNGANAKFLATSGTFDFHKDGTFTKEVDTAYDARNTSASTQKVQHGTYKLAGHTLEMTVGGETVRYTVFTMPDKDEDPPMRFFMNGRMFKRVRP